MPVEIRELQIRVSVNQPDGGQAIPTNAAAGGEAKSDEKDELVSQCVEQVLDILNNKKER